MSEPLLTPAEFAQKIKAQYPVYADVPDAELASKMLEKYPEYRERVKLDEKKSGLGTVGDYVKAKRTWTDVAVDSLPTAAGAVGGLVGGAGGTAFGMGFGGVPGAAAGAALGAGAGQALRDSLNRYRGASAPDTASGEAAAIGTQAGIAGAGTAAIGGLFKGAQAVYPSIVKGASAALDTVSPDLVGIVSPRIAHALRVAQKAVEVVERNLPKDAPKMAINATDFIRIKSLMQQGISQGEAVKTVMNLRVTGKLP